MKYHDISWAFDVSPFSSTCAICKNGSVGKPTKACGHTEVRRSGGIGHARTIETFGHDIHWHWHWHWHSQIRTLAGLAHFAAGFAEVVIGGTINLETRCLSSACLWPFRKREVGMFVSATGSRFFSCLQGSATEMEEAGCRCNAPEGIPKLTNQWLTNGPIEIDVPARQWRDFVKTSSTPALLQSLSRDLDSLWWWWCWWCWRQSRQRRQRGGGGGGRRRGRWGCGCG